VAGQFTAFLTVICYPEWMINTIQIALSGMMAASRKVEASAANIANMTTGGALDPADGSAPYQAVTTAQTSITGANGEGLGVRSEIIPTNRPVVQAYAPDSPFANQDGLIGASNTDPVEDIVNLQIASNSYKANAKTINVASEMQDALLNMFDRKT